jgi:hypothetical protein
VPALATATSVEVVEVELVVVGESVTVVVVGGIGVGVGVGVEPVSANVASAVPVVLPPTAMQNNDGAHETDERRLRSPGGVALGVTDHPLPSHDSTSGLLSVPTAVHAEDATHETPRIGPWLGRTRSDQLVPFQVWVSVPMVTEPLLSISLLIPMATQKLGETQETVCGKFKMLLGAFGLESTDHSVPSHDSIKLSLAASAGL